MTTAQVRHQRGTFIVILLGLVFLALLAALIFTTGKRPAHPTVASSETLSVLPLRVRLRTQPSASAAVVATEPEGTKLQQLEEQGEWVRVQDPDGLSGWTERNSLERTAERERRFARYEAIKKLPSLSAMVTKSAPLYAGPGIFYPVIGELASDTEVRVYTRDHDFYAIDHNGEIAYADVDAIDVSSVGTRQLDVSTETETTTTDTTGTTSTEMPTETTASTPPFPPPPESVPPTETESPADHGVYSAVPLGGTQPQELERVVPSYPMTARRAGVEGAVVVRGIVRRDGTIDDVEIIKDLPYGLGEAAREAVSRWRFNPATYRGEPIDVYYTVTVNFRLH
ncbi:MAG TPA: TonB family protein [Thermoanaerobaculia bacterium]|nr:TonB family protein [Thermoanaerobaculia bacterium]